MFSPGGTIAGVVAVVAGVIAKSTAVHGKIKELQAHHGGAEIASDSSFLKSATMLLLLMQIVQIGLPNTILVPAFVNANLATQ